MIEPDIKELQRLATNASRAALDHPSFKASVDDLLAELAFYTIPDMTEELARAFKMIEAQQAAIENLLQLIELRTKK